MARCTIKLPESFLLKMSKLGDQTDRIAEEALQAGGEVVLAEVRANLQGVVGRDTKYPSLATGELIGSLGLSPVKRDRNENYDIKVGFGEPRSDKAKSNAKLANILEYGKSGQPAKPFLKPARRTSRKACIAAMQEVLEREMGNL